ncbi:MAG: hypothetical protein HY644_10915 [Acidobacteria bacterium]|nr:hypothetical protein [Acidobacteriota bacterium]
MRIAVVHFVLFQCLSLLALLGAAAGAQLNLTRRPDWNQLDPDVLSLIEKRLTAAELQKFVQMSESQDLVRKHYLALAGPKAQKRPDRAQFVLSSMAVLFTDISNQYGAQNDLRNAGAFAAMALKLNPNHVPAMFTLIEIYLQAGNCVAAKSLIGLARDTLARLRTVLQDKPSAPSPTKVYDGMAKQLDLFEKACPP